MIRQRAFAYAGWPLCTFAVSEYISSIGGPLGLLCQAAWLIPAVGYGYALGNDLKQHARVS